jgi:hypothetical protein
MEDGFGGKHFLLQALEPAIGWPEARASKICDSKSWAKFIFVSRFGCIPYFAVDSGTEFCGLTEILFKQYGTIAIMTSLYHPEGNGANERSHKTLVDSIQRACGMDSPCWPLYVHTCLLAMRCTMSRMTGFSPYYLIYGKHPILSFDYNNCTWDTLDWDTIHDTADLLAIRAQQILCHDKDLVLALEKQKPKQKCSVDTFNKKFSDALTSGNFDVRTWVLVHESWLNAQHSNKGAL